MVDWDECMSDARDELGYAEDEYIEDWDRLVEVAHEWKDYYKEEEYMDFCEDAHYQYKSYLESDGWKKLRLKILWRDSFKCQDCSSTATQVHHLNYDHLHTDKESEFCISICSTCHKKRHNINTGKKND